MDEFDTVKCGFNAADETINFGNRLIADGTNLYETVTLATITSSETKTECLSPIIRTSIVNARVFLTVNNSLKVFKDRSCAEVIANISFEDFIDSFAVAKDSNLLLVCLRNGKIIIVDGLKDWQEIYNRSLCENEKDISEENCFVQSFFEKTYQDVFNFLMITRCGYIYRLTIEERSSENYKVDLVELQKNLGIVRDAAFSSPYLLLNGTKLFSLHIIENTFDYDEGLVLKRLLPFNDFFLALDIDGYLYKICSMSLLQFPIHNETLYKDIQLIEDENGNNHLIALTDDKSNDSDGSLLQVLQFSDLSPIYSIRISTKIHLITPKTINDEIMYISEILTSNQKKIKELRICEIRETQPEDRLKRLLKKQQFDDADKIAKLYNLDVELVNKAKAQVIIEKAICTSKEIDELLRLLDLIEDNEFRLRSCNDAQYNCSDINDVQRILDYGSQILCSKGKNKNKRIKNTLAQEHIFDKKHRLQIFLAINQDRDVMRAWTRFSEAYLLDEIKNLVKKGCYEQAMIVYVRLDKNTRSHLNQQHINDILDLTGDIPLRYYQTFMPTFIQVTLKNLPSSITIFLDWIKDKLFSMEENLIEFPNNAIEFTETFIKLIKCNNNNNNNNGTMHCESRWEEFSLLLSALQDIKYLKDNYNIRVQLMDYLSGPNTLIKYLLNIKMYLPEMHEKLIKEFVLDYIKENNLEPNEILLNEITNLTSYDEKVWIHTIPSILNCIESVDTKLNAILTILENCDIPWSEPIRKIAESALIYSDNPLVDPIKQLINEEPIRTVLCREIYAFEDKTIEDIDDFKFYVKRIVYCNQPTMIDDVYKLCIMPEYKFEADIILINNFIKTGNSHEVMKILNIIPESEIQTYIDLIFFDAEIHINSSNFDEDYFNILLPIYIKLKKLGINQQYETYYNLLKSTYLIRKRYNLKITVRDLKEKREEILNSIICNVIEELDIENFYKKCHTISTSFGVNLDKIFVKVCSKLDDYKILVQISEWFLNNCQNVDDLCIMSGLLLKNNGRVKINFNETSILQESFIVPDNNFEDNDLFVKGIIIGEQLFTRASANAEGSDIMGCVEIAPWSSLALYFSNQSDELQKNLFGDSSSYSVTIPRSITFRTISSCFETYTLFMKKFNTPSKKYLKHFTDESEIDENRLIIDLKSLILTFNDLIRDGQITVSYKLLEILNETLTPVIPENKEILRLLRSALNLQRANFLQTLLCSQSINIPMVYSLLLACNQDKAMKILHNSLRLYKQSPQKLQTLSKIGIRFYEYYEISGKSALIKIYNTVKWWLRFQNNNFYYDNFCKMSPDERIQFLMQQKCITIQLLQEYCNDFELNFQIYLVFLLRNTVLNWKIEYEISKNGNLIIKSDQDELLNLCFEIVNLISFNSSSDKTRFLAQIKVLWASTNFYYYEIFNILLEIIKAVNPTYETKKKEDLLLFLKYYKRVNEPNDIEKEQWFSAFPSTQNIDELSKYRLPFNNFFTEKVWTVVRPELTLSTYKYWFNAIDILPQYLNKDEICCFTVKNIVEYGILKNNSDKWAFYPNYENLFEEVDKCIKHIGDLEKSTSALYHLFQHTPDGADKKRVAEMCYYYASLYNEQNPDDPNVAQAFIKVQQKYYQISVAHILKLENIEPQKYINYINKPEKLISKLYHDDRILEGSIHCPDIYRVAENIALLFELNIYEINLELINNWLSNNNSFDSVYDEDNECTDDNFKRALYLCQKGKVCEWRSYLLKSGMNKLEENNILFQVRALKLYAMITDKQTIEELTGYSYEEFMAYIEKLIILNNLEYLGISLEIDALDRYRKTDLLKILGLKTCNGMIVSTMGSICMIYGITEMKYWEYIINCAIHFSLISKLKLYVNFLDFVTYQFYNFYVKAWQLIIESQFAGIDTYPKEKLNQLLITNFLMIQSCPILHLLNLDSIFDKCIKIEKYEFAALLLQYSTKKEFVPEMDDKKVLDKLNELSSCGLWGVPEVKALITSFLSREHKIY